MWLASSVSLLLVCGFFTKSACSLPTISPSSGAQGHNQLISYLSNYGYLPETQEGNSVDYTNALPSAISRFQTMARLPRTGELDERTRKMMNQPRCGVKDPMHQMRRRRYAHSGTKWYKNKLTWGVRRFATNMSNAEVLEVLLQAFRAWSSVTNLNFEYRSTGFVDIEVKFLAGGHDDGYIFDGEGGILAHAFYPPDISDHESSSIAGDLHFDDSEAWAINLHTDGQNLHNVVIHEIGHSLGLEHSNTPGSVMWPWTKDIETQQLTRAELNNDDIRAVQTLYGQHKKQRFQRNENSHYLCRMHVDALMTAVDGRIYAFHGARVTRLDDATLNAVGGSRKIKSVFPGFPDNTSVDAAMTFKGHWSTKKSYIFVGSQYYRYSFGSESLLEDSFYPKYISLGWGLNETSFDSVFTYIHDSMPVFVKGHQYWYHTGTSLGAYENYPKDLRDSRNPYASLGDRPTGKIDAAFRHRNGTNYFLSDEHVYMLDHGASIKVARDIC